MSKFAGLLFIGLFLLSGISFADYKIQLACFPFEGKEELIADMSSIPASWFQSKEYSKDVYYQVDPEDYVKAFIYCSKKYPEFWLKGYQKVAGIGGLSKYHYVWEKKRSMELIQHESALLISYESALIDAMRKAAEGLIKELPKPSASVGPWQNALEDISKWTYFRALGYQATRSSGRLFHLRGSTVEDANRLLKFIRDDSAKKEITWDDYTKYTIFTNVASSPLEMSSDEKYADPAFQILAELRKITAKVSEAEAKAIQKLLQ